MSWEHAFELSLPLVGLVIFGYIVLLARWGLAVLESRMLIATLRYQADAVHEAVSEAGGELIVAMQQGDLLVGDLKADNVRILEAARYVSEQVPEQLAKLGIPAGRVPRILIATVGRWIAQDPGVPIVPLLRPVEVGAAEPMPVVAPEPPHIVEVIFNERPGLWQRLQLWWHQPRPWLAWLDFRPKAPRQPAETGSEPEHIGRAADHGASVSGPIFPHFNVTVPMPSGTATPRRATAGAELADHA